MSDRPAADHSASIQRQTLFLAQAHDAIILTDVEGTITEWNRGAEQALGFSAKEMIGRPIGEIYAPAVWQALEAKVMADLLSTGEHDSVMRARHKSGREVVLDARLVLLRGDDGEPVGMAGYSLDITARAAAEQALAESESRLRNILDSMYTFVGLFSPDGVLIEINRAPLDATGVSREDVVGKVFWDAYWWSYDPAVQARLRNAFQGAARGETVREDVVARFAEGVFRTMDGIFGPLYDSEGRIVQVIASGTDVTERTIVEADLRRNQARLRVALDTLGATTFDQDADLRYTWMQRPLPGFTVEDVIGKTDEEVLGVEGARAITPLKRRALERGERVAGEVPVSFGGETRYYQLIVEPLPDGDGQARGLVGVSLDVTERQRSLELQSRLEAQLAQARKLEAIGTLAGGVAHDFNNILGAILGNTQLALRLLGADHPVVASLVEIDRAAQRGAELVRQILAFGHLGPGQHTLLELATVVTEAVDLIRANLPPAVELVVSTAAATPEVLANATQAHQVVMNLCANAVHAIGAGPGRIDVRLDGVVLDARAPEVHADLSPGLYARLSVSDSGPGMDAATLERIFEPFFTTKAVGEGTGLGLSVVHGIAGAHRGAVTASSAPGRGSTFAVYFPAVGAPGTGSGEPGEVGDEPVGAGAHVLFIDDEESLVWLGIGQLELLGYRVTGFSSAAEALDALRADPQGFDLVITDFTMPGVSGLDVASEVRCIRPDLPVAVTSGRVTPELQAGAEAAGIGSVLPKPYTVGELARVARLLTATARPGRPSSQ